MIVVHDANHYYKLGIVTLLNAALRSYVLMPSARMQQEPNVVLVAVDALPSPHYCMEYKKNTFYFTIRDKIKRCTLRSCALESGIIYRNEPALIVVERILQVIKEQDMRRLFLNKLRSQCKIPKLSLIETHILRCLHNGMSPTRIASLFNIHVKTVSGHKINAMEKLQIRRNTELLIWFQKGGLDALFPRYCIRKGF
ncbi:helix-turn-helix transcriptional regulator [Serratia fonticola]|jgi:DNA-binding CsgD family transcriptional regulator|uniref:Helix-turn-helix transcriptional regulator n=1 Tax=Serratia fonticola TaxID=47917 RepID=A0AAW3WY82_SERFO|nr:helix-turn-helix transcriptional regulator [Serratia fonticola]ALX97454.1 hypothetical protein AV650_28265 [Serratia fonticola]MBC3214587.1 helix-turn-helix transcriptional regulator [Serratia fonticola]NYA15212.1 helix-turn-helix transcriptional regulator [Serratia fonticola]NYA35328.1 helix-turn-helix transcriptional regulator [Serratia fonticola]